MPSRFHFDVQDVPVEQAVELGQISDTLERLEARKKTEIAVVDHFLRSMLAWKVATFQQSVL
jgi:hypothetical protein